MCKMVYRVVAVLFSLVCGVSAEDQVLYNGIRLPEPWPPKAGATDYEPMRVPYLESPPRVIPIDIGRQLFVDDFLIRETTLKRAFHLAEYYPQNPVLKPERPWEKETSDPSAMVFSDGVWYDPQDHLFKMWYMGGYMKATGYAVSKDGITWEKPGLDVKPGTNVVVVEDQMRDSTTVWLDLDEKDPSRRFKLFVVRGTRGGWRGFVQMSADGTHWGDPVADTGRVAGDRSTIFYNVSERYGDWNWGNVQSAGGGCLTVGDKLYFYVSGRAGVQGASASGVCSTGLAVLRRDGFASMDARETAGTLSTRPLRFSGKYLFVNLDANQGELRVEALDETGKVLAPFTKENCIAVQADSTLQPVTWRGASDLSALSGKPVVFRFHLNNSRLYAFWVSNDPSGASEGYVARVSVAGQENRNARSAVPGASFSS